MVRFCAACVALLAATSFANGQAVIDGSSSGIEPAVVSAALSNVTKELKDPSSAQARGLQLIHTSDARPNVICGYINAKNSFGGYVGFRPFYYEANRKLGGIVHDVSNSLERLPLEWSGCAAALKQ